MATPSITRRPSHRAVPWTRRVLALVAICVMGFLMLPLVIVFPVSITSGDYLQFPPQGFSLRWYQTFLDSGGWIDATVLSFRIALCVAALSSALGVPIAFMLVRSRARWATTLLDKVFVAPMIVPAVISAVSIYSLFSRWHLIGDANALVVAHTVLALPVLIVVVSAGVRQLDLSLEHAAMGLGASRVRVLLHVTFPLLLPSLLSGAFLAFMTSFDDLIVALFLSGSNYTLPKRMFDNIGYQLDPTIAAVAVLQIVALILIGVVWLCVVRRVKRRSAGAVGHGLEPTT